MIVMVKLTNALDTQFVLVPFGPTTKVVRCNTGGFVVVVDGGGKYNVGVTESLDEITMAFNKAVVAQQKELVAAGLPVEEDEDIKTRMEALRFKFPRYSKIKELQKGETLSPEEAHLRAVEEKEVYDALQRAEAQVHNHLYEERVKAFKNFENIVAYKPWLGKAKHTDFEFLNHRDVFLCCGDGRLYKKLQLENLVGNAMALYGECGMSHFMPKTIVVRVEEIVVCRVARLQCVPPEHVVGPR